MTLATLGAQALQFLYSTTPISFALANTVLDVIFRLLYVSLFCLSA